MANTYVDTGHGATATFATSGFSLNITSIDLGEQTIEDVEKTHLGTSGFREFMPGDLKTPNEVTMPFQWDTSAAEVAISEVETVTITFPIPAAGTAATLAGTAYIKRNKFPNLQTDTIQDGELIVQFDGVTGPTYTAFSAS